MRSQRQCKLIEISLVQAGKMFAKIYVWGLCQKTDRWTDMKWLWLIVPACECASELTEPIDRVRRPVSEELRLELHSPGNS